MPLTTTPGATALIYARNRSTGLTYYVGQSSPAGPPYVIIGDFGEQHAPADLPTNGAIPADWDAVGDPAHQMTVGEGLIYSPFDPTAPDAGYLFSFVGTTANPTGWVRAGRLTGAPGPTGVSSVIVGDFGAITTPADLPPDGLIPIDWDGPGNPAAPLQMVQGWSLYYDQPTDTALDGHLFQYVGTGIDPAGWLDIGLIQGPEGPPGQIGPEGPQSDDIYVGPDDPATIKPTTELWFDTDDTRLIGPYDLPMGGVTYAALSKKSDLDGDIEWRDVYVMPTGKILQFPNVADVAKIHLYSTTFGFGITGGTLEIFASSHVSFRNNSVTGTQWAVINASGLTIRGANTGVTFPGGSMIYDHTDKPLTLRQRSGNARPQIRNQDGSNARDIWCAGAATYEVSFQNGFSGTMDFRVNDAMVTMRITALKKSTTTAAKTQYEICDLPAGVPAPWGEIWQAVIIREADWDSYYTGAEVGVNANGVHLHITNDNMVANERFIDCTISWAR